MRRSPCTASNFTAQVCRANGVCGEDLLGMTTATLVEDLRCTPIAARKVLGARDRYFR